jgi:hypothetical protein
MTSAAMPFSLAARLKLRDVMGAAEHLLAATGDRGVLCALDTGQDS